MIAIQYFLHTMYFVDSQYSWWVIGLLYIRMRTVNRVDAADSCKLVVEGVFRPSIHSVASCCDSLAPNFS